MNDIEAIESVLAAVRSKMDAEKALIAAMSEEEKKQYVKQLLYIEFANTIGKGVLH